MKEIKGISHNLNNSIIGKLCIKNNIFAKNKILFCTKKPLFSVGIKAFIVPSDYMFKTNLPVIEIKDNKMPFDCGDVVNISKDGRINVLWEIKSDHNAFYVTDICNVLLMQFEIHQFVVFLKGFLQIYQIYLQYLITLHLLKHLKQFVQYYIYFS